jgi:hypothetical protein
VVFYQPIWTTAPRYLTPPAFFAVFEQLSNAEFEPNWDSMHSVMCNRLIVERGSSMDAYVVRKIVYGNRYGAVHVYDEGIATTFEKAVEMAPKMDLEPDDDFLFEITKRPIDSYSEDYFSDVWHLDNQGKQLNRDCPEPANSFVVNVGDIVRIFPFPKVPCSELFKEDIGIVVEKLIDDEDTGIEHLVVETIDSEGDLDHFHVHPCSKSMTVLADVDVPERLSFLKVLREHVTGRAPIEKEKWDQIINKEVSLFNWLGTE